MCYTGCRYERTWGEGAGECSLPNGEKPPIDAMCSVNEIECENAKLRELVQDVWSAFVYAMQGGIITRGCGEPLEQRMRELGIEVD